MRAAKNGLQKDYRAGVRGYVQLNTHTHTHAHTTKLI